MATERVPAEVFPPGEILKDELEARGWTQADLAEIIGRHPTTVNEIISGKSGISHDMARVLAAALGAFTGLLFASGDDLPQISALDDYAPGVARHDTERPCPDQTRRVVSVGRLGNRRAAFSEQ